MITVSFKYRPTMQSYINSCCLVLAVLVTVGATQSTTKTIPLNKNFTIKNKELYSDFVFLNKLSSLQVSFTDVGTNVSFIIFQVHSHLYNVTLTSVLKNWSVTGTNIGLYSSVKNLDTFLIENLNVDLKLFITVLGYVDKDPIPGGCNQELSLPISPFMKAIHNKTYVDVQAASPNDLTNDPDCEKNVVYDHIAMEFYMMYLPESNYDSDAYFEAIKKMTTLESIENNNAYLIPMSASNYWINRRRVSAYPGTGAVYVVVAKDYDLHTYSVYVPTHSYACSPLIKHDCDLLDTPLTMFMSLLLFFIGIFLCYFGHWFFKTQIVTVGCLSGFIVTYIIVLIMFRIDSPDIFKAAAISGLCIGALRLVCWWLFGIPAYIIVLSSADIGFLIASILYFMSPGGVFLQSNTTFWSVFILVILVTTISLLWTSNIASMLCSSMIGGYAAIYPLDYYMGSNLKYIINNTIRRATVPEFNKAIINPPHQWRDIFLIVIWVLLAVSGFLYQFYYNMGRPPFPPPPRSVRAVPEAPVIPSLRRRSSVAIFWATWVSRCKQRRSSNFVRNMNENTPLLEEEGE